ncbi:hypothetical protein OHT52_13205 [Streptomyces sp. NBC_00247]|uniref:hypothetical protein n=1 Tax=Streptomyces sp. NBC_00247 TaxID=2975689 RepID=UPI002E2A1443|nr:hypothetical protein [Streptomyces sp. NBC_00247]
MPGLPLPDALAIPPYDIRVASAPSSVRATARMSADEPDAVVLELFIVVPFLPVGRL